MTQRQRETIAKLAIKKYGNSVQLRQLQKECTELIVAISHYLRNGQTAREELIEGVADVTIILIQLYPILNYTDEVSDMIDHKLEILYSKL